MGPYSFTCRILIYVIFKWRGTSGFVADEVIPYPYPYLNFGYQGKPKPKPITGQLRYYLSKSGRIRAGTHEYGFSCHVCSWCRNILDPWCMGEWGCIVVQNFRAPLPFPSVTEEFVSLLNGVDVWFRVIITSNLCLLSWNFLASLVAFCDSPFSPVHFLCFFKVFILSDHVFLFVWFHHRYKL